jgi:CRISPR-associated protein Csm2
MKMTMHDLLVMDETGQQMVTFAQQTAERLVRDKLTRSQIRSIFTEVRQIEALWPQSGGEALRRLTMLKPKMAYQTARSQPVEYLAQVLGEAIDEVAKAPVEKRDAVFQRFMDLFEAILAYHRAKGGRN